MAVTLNGVQRVLMSGPKNDVNNASFAADQTIVTPAQTVRQFAWAGVMEVFSETHLVFLLALLLACGGLAWPRVATMLAGFTLAYGGDFAAVAAGAPPTVMPWLSVGLALSLWCVGLECWRASRLSWTERGARRGVTLVACAVASGLVHGCAAGTGLRLPEESATFSVGAWLLGATTVVVLLSAAVLPVMAGDTVK